MPAGKESPFPPSLPFKLTLTNEVMLLVRSRRNTFNLAGKVQGRAFPLLFKTRFFAVLANSTYRPSALSTGATESPLPTAGGICAELMTDTHCNEAPLQATSPAFNKSTAWRPPIRIRKSLHLMIIFGSTLPIVGQEEN